VFCFDVISLEKRQEFSIPLAKISIGTDSLTGKYIRAKIFYLDEKEHSIISGDNDILVKTTSKGTEKTLYREEASRAFLISEFEAHELGKTCKGFIQTLEILEHDLKDAKYEKIRYLDGFFPKFLKSFKILLLLTKNENDCRQINNLLPDTAFDVSINSPKTDSRVLIWQSQKDYILKLRIVTKELAYQLKMWESKELSSKNQIDMMKCAEVEEILDLFIKVYFNFPADIKNIKEKHEN
jgi:hypothetical protein